MTLREIEQSGEAFLVPADVAEVVGCKPYAINVQAREDPSRLGFAVCVTGTRVRIPREAFLRWLKHGNAPILVRDAET